MPDIIMYIHQFYYCPQYASIELRALFNIIITFFFFPGPLIQPDRNQLKLHYTARRLSVLIFFHAGPGRE